MQVSLKTVTYNITFTQVTNLNKIKTKQNISMLIRKLKFYFSVLYLVRLFCTNHNITTLLHKVLNTKIDDKDNIVNNIKLKVHSHNTRCTDLFYSHVPVLYVEFSRSFS